MVRVSVPTYRSTPPRSVSPFAERIPEQSGDSFRFEAVSGKEKAPFARREVLIDCGGLSSSTYPAWRAGSEKG